MPATESIWRDTSLLHRVFAVVGVVLTIGTVWMFWKDHARSWKTYQVEINNIDLKMNQLRQEQYETGDALLEHQQRQRELAAVKATPVVESLVQEFTALATKLNNEVLGKWKDKGYPYTLISFNDTALQRDAAALAEAAADAHQKRAAAEAAAKAADEALAKLQANPTDDKLHTALRDLEKVAHETEAAAERAESAAAEMRADLVTAMQAVVDDARVREDKALGIRKFKSGEIDAAKANVDIAIRDNLAAERIARQERVDELMGDVDHPEADAEAGKDTLAALNYIYQTISKSRRDLERNVKLARADIEQAQKAYDESLAELERLRKQFDDRDEPWYGKHLLTLPILDAFNSPRKIENLWSDGLTQNYNFSNVRRFDRCTTCHQSLAKTQPGSATAPAYVKEHRLEMVIVPPAKDAAPKPRITAEGETRDPQLEDWLGLRLARSGLLRPDDITVGLVLPTTPAARADILSHIPSNEQELGIEFREQVAQLVSPPGHGDNLFPSLPGLQVGDVIEAINGEPLATSGGGRTPERIAQHLILLAEEGKPIQLRIRRGLPNPYISHPRLDLFVSDSSPHRMQLFACTICHDGQGSSTSFQWASHTPSTVNDMEDWTKKHGWFDNPHWIYPQYARRFAEASCLKCHHEVVELEPSEKFADAPAPKVTHGYHLFRKYGCFGCHEVNGFDGPSRRVGPDLRSEPNYFAVAQQIEAELNAAGRAAGESATSESAATERLTFWREHLSGLLSPVINHPEESGPRLSLKSTIDEAVAAAGKDATKLDQSLLSLANMLKDVETPGTLRRPGPSLRFLGKKADPVFVYDWIDNPQHFRPSSRMPRFFGLWNHLQDGHGHGDEKAPRLEPIEIRGILAYIDDYSADQEFAFEKRPSGIASWTAEEKVARGKVQFQTRGCLACHSHSEFPDVEKYRSPEEIVQGPDLSGVGTKFAPDRNPNGPDWLYSWIKNPTRYHVRTVMPNLFLEPERDPGADANSTADDRWFDPADDIVSYLLASSKVDWQPIPQAMAVTQPLAEDDPALKELMLEYLNEAFYKFAADQYYMHGIPPELERELKGAEKDLIVRPGERLTNKQRLKYLGRKSISKYGCFGCHDIPGFEDAKPIGTGLADWGRKDPAKLAFEHINHYIEHGHGHSAPPPPAAGGHEAAVGKSKTSGEALYADSPARSTAANPAAAANTAAAGQAHDAAPAAEHSADSHDDSAESEEFQTFYRHALEAGNRIGFIYQKLKEPRSYDFDKTEIKRYNERLRMPQFPFTAREREAVVTFVLGLVAEPPQPKYIFKPKDRNAALIAGRQVLEKYNCGGCHVLGLERWELSYAAGEFGERPETAMYPFLRAHFSPHDLAAAAKPDRRGELHSVLEGMPPTDRADGLPVVTDLDGGALENEAPYAERELKLGIDLYKNAIVDGSPYVTGQQAVFASQAQIDARYPTWGGVLTKYLLPVVTKLERQTNPNASGAEAFGWVPPPLVNQGNKVQTAWLHDFLLDPHPIRPAVFLRMPKFNMSGAEATTLANYFAAVDNAAFPYSYASSRDRNRLARLEAQFVEAAGGEQRAGGAEQAVAATSGEADGMRRLDAAMKIVVDGNFCVKCHLVADFVPSGSARAKAPNLADVYRRLRPDFVRDWIANPKAFLPYTSMPVNIPYENPPPILNELYPGTNVEQIQALTDLLMNFDQFARQNTRIADRVKPAPMEGAAPGGTPPATGGGN